MNGVAGPGESQGQVPTWQKAVGNQWWVRQSGFGRPHEQVRLNRLVGKSIGHGLRASQPLNGAKHLLVPIVDAFPQAALDLLPRKGFVNEEIAAFRDGLLCPVDDAA